MLDDKKRIKEGNKKKAGNKRRHLQLHTEEFLWISAKAVLLAALDSSKMDDKTEELSGQLKSKLFSCLVNSHSKRFTENNLSGTVKQSLRPKNIYKNKYQRCLSETLISVYSVFVKRLLSVVYLKDLILKKWKIF